MEPLQQKGNSITKRESPENTSISTRLEKIQVGTLSNKDDKAVRASGAEQTLSSGKTTIEAHQNYLYKLPPDRLSQDCKPSSHSSVEKYLERVDSTSHDESLLAEMANREQELVGAEGSQVD